MAPALNEPLSPTRSTEKLNKNTVSATTVPVTRSTRRQSALGAAPTIKTATSPTGVGIGVVPTTSRESKARKSDTPDTTATTIITRRRTRSKESANNNNNKTSTEQMGLNEAALSTSNHNNNNAQNIDNKNNNSKESTTESVATTSNTTTTATKETTQEILANLTINFEEAISAEICLRKQLLDSNLNKEATKKTNGTELKDILVIKGNDVNSVATDSNTQEEHTQHMEESVLDKNLPPKNNESENTVEEQKEANENVLEEDTLEARLSQLDGSICDIPKITTTETTSTPTIETHDLQDLQAQLQLSPVKSTQDDELKDLQVQTTQDDLRELQAQLQLSPAKTADIGPIQMLVEEQVVAQHNQESTNMPQLVANTGDIEEEDLEEVIRALKGFDPATAGPETLCDLNAIFGEVYQNMNYEDVHTTQTASITSSISPIKNIPLHEAQLEIDKTQQVIQRKLEFLIRRLRKLQARHMCKHTSEELAGIFEYTVRTVNNTLSCSSLLNREANDDAKPAFMSVISARPLPELWKEEREFAVPATQVYNLMRKVDTAAKAQQLCTVSPSPTTNINTLNLGRKPRKSSAALDTTQMSSPNETITSTAPESIIPTLDAMAVEEITQVTGMLQAEMREVQQSIDSEVTESSSGCESADEMISYNNHIQQTLPIEKRAAWRYARDRASIAARWSWLMSHIADLDIKMRQHTELYNEIVRNKGPVIENLDNAQEEDDDSGSCRTRGYLSTQFRKRKLLQTANIHTISKKAARPR